MLIHPAEPSPGAIGVFAKYGRMEEIKALEQTAELRTWEIRGIISDCVPLAGGADDVLGRGQHHRLYLNENPLRIYLHSGGHNAVYYEMVGDSDQKLLYIGVKVASKLPSNALLLARKPLNALLDVFTRDSDMPLQLQRLELVSPMDGEVLLFQMLIPHRNGVKLGPLGGIVQAVPFAPYDALYREALTSSSPFYRFLCAWKIYEGSQRLRRWMREQSEQRKVKEKMPSDPPVDPQHLIRIGMQPAFAQEIKTAKQLFDKFQNERNAIAHFLLKHNSGESHVYLAEGPEYEKYAIGAAALLHYAHKLLEELRIFCVKHLPMISGPAILPTPESRDRFIVRATDYGLQ